MLSVFPRRNGDCAQIEFLSARIDAGRFQPAIRRLHARFACFSNFCPAPFPAPGLIITPEIRRQSELYLPLEEITSLFTLLYHSALTYPPILSSSPFHNALSWADVFISLPPRFQFSVNPARLLESLLTNSSLLTEFLFASFLPRRFSGGFRRYPGQQDFIRTWLKGRNEQQIRCLDAACGSGEDTYALAGILQDHGYRANDVRVEGWTLEPLEVWCATHGCFPHDRKREEKFRGETAKLFEHQYTSALFFLCADLRAPSTFFPQSRQRARENFNLILCNGLLGGPILGQGEKLELVIGHLNDLLAPGGIVLAADCFHNGWKQICPQEKLRRLFAAGGLKTFEAGEGIGGLKPSS